MRTEWQSGLTFIFCVHFVLTFLAYTVVCADAEHHLSFSDKFQFKESDKYYKIMGKDNKDVSSWEAHSQTVRACNTASLGELTDGTWYINEQGHYLYEPHSCTLTRMSGQQARSCLNGKHIVFAGDSVTRYQYVHLAYLLSQLQRMERYGGQPGHPSFCIETEWGDWSEYYQYTSTVLGTVANGFGYEVCDCSRAKNTPLERIREYRTLHIDFNREQCRNDFFRLRSNISDGTSRDYLTLSYHQVFRFPDPVTAGKSTLKYYEDSYRQQPATLFIFNMGLHIENLGAHFNSTLSTILESGAGMKAKHNTNMLWKTTTNVNEMRDVEIQIATVNRYTVYDVGKIVASGDAQGLVCRWDTAHFLPFVYEQFNDVLLNYLCTDSQ